MPAFHYIAVNPSGQEQKGVIEADNERQARQSLRDSHLLPLSLHSAQEKKSRANWWDKLSLPRLRGISRKELAFITRQFATLLKAGLPVEEALTAVGEQADKPHLKGLVFSVRSKVVEGHALAATLREFPQAFPDWYVATVAAGERSGHLDQVLLRLADYTEQQWQTQQKIRMALIYPVMIILVSIGIVGFLLEYVVPKMVAIYGQLGQSLPLLTSVLIALSSGIQTWGVYVFVLAMIVAYFFRRAMRRDKVFRTRVQQLALRLPGLGYFVRTTNTARFSRTLALLCAAGVPLLEAMAIAAKLVTCIPIREALEVAAKRVREGAAMHLALKQTTYFQPMNIHLIASGEAGGQLEPMLERVAQQQEEDMKRLIDVSLALFEPMMILIMGAIVLFIVLAVMLPIFQLNQLSM
ncbi:MAG: type II secretion system protein GspF [Gammaproteobacteria bacterium RIFCSPHIGHO2_12_FULL_41_20]|nr:MAG: type II secretion system protein GspF [Gammaproteobacteria bacterium RIFCSPHIGHO2_12_FULL_41_20]